MWQRNAILLIGFLLLIVPTSAVNITSTHIYSHIQWHWDACGDPSLIDNITVDNYPVCSFNLSYQDFLLVGLEPSSFHYINITCEGNSTLSGVTTDAAPVYMTVMTPNLNRDARITDPLTWIKNRFNDIRRIER